MTALYIVLGVVGFVLLALALSYNRFVSQRNLIKDSWSNIDTELTRRYDLIPNLVETVKGYATHERELFENVTRARAAAAASQGPPEEQATAEAPLVQGVRRLLAVAEDYPDLKASENFLELQRQLTETEDRLQAARRFYNGNVRDFNRRVQSFPSNLVAGMLSFVEAQFFEVEESVRRPTQVALPEP